jgi:hypothetical protein
MQFRNIRDATAEAAKETLAIIDNEAAIDQRGVGTAEKLGDISLMMGLWI